jgi:membrane associated rhomboid family serine protease
MFLYIPYGTSASVYHLPIITVTMITINVLVFFMCTQCTPDQIEPFMLAMGDGLHPLQWLTTNFLHANIFHLFANMLFLWVFGLVVEGKIGAFKMLAVYLGICVLFGAAVQILTLGCEPGFRLGSSGVIFGLAAMSFIWAPEEKIYAFLPYWVLFRIGIKDLETDISTLVGFFAVLLIAWSCFFGSGLIGELGHIVGAVLGLVVAITMLKRNLVDCEDGDLLAIWSGKSDRPEVEAKRPDAIQRREERKQRRLKRKNLLAEEIELALQNKTPLPAYILAQRKEREFTDWTLSQELHLKMIQQLLGGRHEVEAIASMRQYLERHREQSVFVRLMLAQAHLSQNEPKSALRVLDDILPGAPEQKSAIPKIRAKAEAMHRKNIDEGIYEVDG